MCLDNSIAMSVAVESMVDWRDVHGKLMGIAAKRAALDADEARWLRVAGAAAVAALRDGQRDGLHGSRAGLCTADGERATARRAGAGGAAGDRSGARTRRRDVLGGERSDAGGD